MSSHAEIAPFATINDERRKEIFTSQQSIKVVILKMRRNSCSDLSGLELSAVQARKD